MAVGDILTSGARIWYAPTGESLPDETSIAWNAAWGGNWTQLAELAAPLNLEYFEARTDSDVQNALSPVKDWRIAETLGLRSVFNEVDGDTLALLTHGSNSDTAAGGSQKPYSRILGGGDPIVDQYAVGFEGYRPDSAGTFQPVRFFFYLASFMLDRGFSLDKQNQTKLPFMIKTYADTSKAIGQQLFEWHIVTGPTS